MSLISSLKDRRDAWIALLSTLFILFIFQLGIHITAPCIKLTNVSTNSSLSQLLNFLGGGGLKRVSLFSVGLSPYITSQIIIQLLSNDVIKHFSELRKSGERGRLRLEFYTRLLTFPFAVLTALGAITLVSGTGMITFTKFDGTQSKSFSELPVTEKTMLILMFVSGTYISLFLSDVISKRGLGNGITILIMSGIVAALPENFISTYNYLGNDDTVVAEHKQFINAFKFVFYIFLYLMILLLIVFINGSVRKIPLQQSGHKIPTEPKNVTYLPIKLMPAGILPVVFAGSIMVLPSAIGELVSGGGGSSFIRNYLSMNSGFGLFLYFLLIIFFSFVYSHIQINVEETTKSFASSGIFIPGVRSGQPTFNYLKSILNRINCFGAPILAIVAVFPSFLNLIIGLPNTMSLGGTGIIILVSGSVQIIESLKSNLIASRYKSKNIQMDTHLSSKEGRSKSGSFYLW